LILFSTKGGENGNGIPNGGEEQKPPPTFDEMWFDDPVEVYAKSKTFCNHIDGDVF